MPIRRSYYHPPDVLAILASIKPREHSQWVNEAIRHYAAVQRDETIAASTVGVLLDRIATLERRMAALEDKQAGQ